MLPELDQARRMTPPRQRTRHTKRLVGIAALACVLGAGASAAMAQTNAVYFTGHGLSSALGADVTIAASRSVNGTVRGMAVCKDSFIGNAVEVVPPSGSHDYWCINFLIEGMPGYNSIWLIKDLLSGDSATSVDGPGLACADAPVPIPGAFQAIDTGDFVGEIVPDTCAGDLATCNAQAATLTSQLGQCQADLGTCSANLAQCQTDLADCTDKCELPLLPPNYDAKLTGTGFYEPLNTKVKISATRTSLGTFKGAIAAAGQWQATVTDLVAPSDGKPYWCVNSVINDALGNPSLIGKNAVLFVKDSGKGCDPLAYQVGDGLSCSSAGPGVFASISTGNFTGKVLCGAKMCCL